MKDVIADTAKISDATLTNATIGNATITSAMIQDGAITNAKISDLTVGRIKIANYELTEISSLYNANTVTVTTTWLTIDSLTVNTLYGYSTPIIWSASLTAT